MGPTPTEAQCPVSPGRQCSERMTTGHTPKGTAVLPAQCPCFCHSACALAQTCPLSPGETVTGA